MQRTVSSKTWNTDILTNLTSLTNLHKDHAGNVHSALLMQMSLFLYMKVSGPNEKKISLSI
jgi:hypothetical protein